ncbi:hypothetical protein O0I10_008326 [Lichtheimia ornata]|uniref:GPI transamidase component PIG-S n=1 Tax=Lichtheimia ornata TaxID=688661 RepID=A0AAD7UYN9_9FUNG|nr:uncharacterized protein O0I10_008326 [Lichtheimia ornata]KAJ8655887.1 hypothetical protein O0I10_008326 [Lichtheimia ornata]
MSTRMVIVAFWAFILVGLPFWWKTTEVYRANLPLNEIKAWQEDQSPRLELPITFIVHSAIDVTRSLQDRLSEKTQIIASCAIFPVQVKWQYWTQEKDDNVEELLTRHNDMSFGHYHIYASSSPSSSSAVPCNITVGNTRTSHVQVADMSQESIAEAVMKLFDSAFVEEYKHLDQMACGTRDNDNKNDMSSMRSFKYSPRYQITFSLMNNDPEHLLVDWDIREAVKSYMHPLLKEISMVSNFTVDSQIQNYASLSIPPFERERPGKPSYYYYEQGQLSHFINSADWNLASTISSYPTVNFILYIPSPTQRLWIHDVHNRPLPDNAFLIPRWGGVLIKNLPKAPDGHYRLDKQKLHSTMRIFVSQLRSLIGIHEHDSVETSDTSITYSTSPHTGITLLEKDNLIRRCTVENIANAAKTLNSLAQLVTEIPNMVVLEEINTQVRHSLRDLELGREALRNADYESALKHSIRATKLAEEAFFNPTMVSMLYFPDEHKYAIYMPLFVPISVPLVMAVLKGLKRKEPKKKTE